MYGFKTSTSFRPLTCCVPRVRRFVAKAPVPRQLIFKQTGTFQETTKMRSFSTGKIYSGTYAKSTIYIKQNSLQT